MRPLLGTMLAPVKKDEIMLDWEKDLLSGKMATIGQLRDAERKGRELARKELRDLLRKTRDYTPSSRLAAAIAWASDDLEQMTGMFPGTRQEGCSYTLDECPYDWCAVHDDVTDTYYCTPACVVGHERLGERCGG